MSPDDMPELANRLAWLVRLRWAAATGLALVSLAAPAIGLPALWPGLLFIAAAVAVYNLHCRYQLFRLAGTREVARGLHKTALVQITFDLGALLIVVHLTGGLASPLLPFFGFHMAIGTILLSSETMYLIAGIASLSAVALHVFEAGGFAYEGAAASPLAVDGSLGLLAFVSFLFGIVYLTGSVSDRLKERNRELRRTTETLRHRTEDLQRANAELEELERRKSHYMRISAHQLRSPLGTVRTSLDVLASGYVDPASERGRNLLLGATDRVNGLLATVNDLLELAKVREGKQRAPWAPQVNLHQLVVDLLDTLGPFAEERDVRLVADIGASLVLDWGVPPDLVHAIENLIHNAIKYSHHGGEVIVRLHEEDRAAVLRVEDHGIGVPRDFREQLFLEFVRAPNARAHAPGTGLGLALTREVAGAHGGRVFLEENAGPGAAFRLELPLHHTPATVTPR